jgi:hypothetical protein
LNWAKGFGNATKLNGWGGSLLPPLFVTTSQFVYSTGQVLSDI